MELPVIVAVALVVAAAATGFVAGRRGRTPTPADATPEPDERSGVDPAPVGPLLDPEGEALVAAMPIGVVHFDDRLRIDWANPAASALLGRPDAGLLGRSVMEAFLDTRVDALLRTTRMTGPATAEVQARDGDGRSLMLRARRSSAAGLWLVMEDVTELRRLQQIRAEFIDNLSHELRTPLTTISLLAETLARDADATGAAIPTRMRERIGKVEEETGHLVQMVTELLDLSRIESGPPLALRDVIDVSRLATSSAERLRLFAERQGVRLVIDVADDSPPVRADEERLGQVFVNLLHNAVKFSPDGGSVTVRVRPRDFGREVIVAIEDHGIGIPRSAQRRVFERFYKVDRARVRGGGTGLGLSIARHIVEAHGGRIELVSEEGRGSTFTVVLPAADARAGTEPRATADASQPGGPAVAGEPGLAAPADAVSTSHGG